MANKVVVVFDTDCVLCAGWVQFLLRHEAHDRTVFVSAWSVIGAALASKHGLSPADLQKTFLVEVDGVGLTRSAAALALLGQLRWPWRAGRVLWLIPRPLRDAAYDLAAERRYRWFGRRSSCFLPPPKAAHRFIDRDRPQGTV